MESQKTIIENIQNFEPIDDNWLRLDKLLIQLFKTKNPENGLTTLFNVFERFPDEDGAGVFWSIVHHIEDFKSYENELIKSIQRMPSEMAILMVNRIKNTGRAKIGHTHIKYILRGALNHPKISDENSDNIIDFLNE